MYITQDKLLKLGLCSNAMYVFLFFLFQPDGINLQKIIISGFLAFSVVTSLIICFQNRQSLNQLPSLYRRTFIFLMIWSLITIIRGFSFNIQDWVTNFGNVYMALAWVTPVFIIIGQKIENWVIFYKSIVFMFQLMLISLFALPFYIGPSKLRTEWVWLLRPINFILLLGVSRFKSQFRVLVYVTFVVYILMAILTEQRIEFIYLFLVFGFIAIRKLKQIKIKRKFLKYILLASVALVTIIFTYGYENISNIIKVFVEYEDTRVFLYNELIYELKGVEDYIGRGSLGTYYSHYMEHTKWYIEEIRGEKWFGDSSTRITIEVGYLQMILKGGYILFFLTFFLMVSSSYLAIFKSNNSFIRNLGLYILTLTILSIISFRPAFTPTFIILWTAIGTVLNKKYRKMSDQEIKELINI
ncbi:hypothetical protein [Corallibacter sp.]|uniref:hypothetical protein n=1 Tax=Corallibacter sp. TaxID=2038084 RepID=UPI003AB3CCF6